MGDTTIHFRHGTESPGLHRKVEPAPKVVRLGVNWRATRQSFYYNSEYYAHVGPTTTTPSHDIAHVLVAAASSLPWLPSGSNFNVRIAEFNAVMSETLLDKVFHAVYTETVQPANIVEVAIAHARWFVEKHYAPFPITWRTAAAQFAHGIHVDHLIRLSPYFFRQRWREVAHGETDRPCRICFSSDHLPTTTDEVIACQDILSEQWGVLLEVCGSMTSKGPRTN